MHKILFATSEVHPLIKTGGLADVSASLPQALKNSGHDVRIILPAYPEALTQLEELEKHTEIETDFGSVSLVQSRLPGTDVPVYLVAAAGLFDRPGNPYLDTTGKPWTDNAERFYRFAQAVTAVSLNKASLEWRPDILHCNDWQTGMVPVLLSTYKNRPATIFTIHNLAYQGLFDYETFHSLKIPEKFWHPDALEYFGQFSFIKGGLIFADYITTVSPGYAQEIQTEAYGCGLNGLLKSRHENLFGILNGIDEATWNPAIDSLITIPYTASSIEYKPVNTSSLRQIFALPNKPAFPLIGMIGRLVEQKGIDLFLDALPELVKLPLQFVLLGAGEAKFEKALREWSSRHPDKLSTRIGYDEGLAHRIEAGADMFLMPSRFEPCGLNQMYSMRYATIPIVRRVGGLGDTVIDSNPQSLATDTATGIVFEDASAKALIQAVQRALKLYEDEPLWRQLQKNGMHKDFSWQHSARQYLEVYRLATASTARKSA